MSRVALVTGAARGIGAATTRRLAADGWRVVAVDICADDPALPYPLARRDELEALRAAGDVTTVVADVRDLDALAHAVEVAKGTYGGLDAAVAVAGVIAGGREHWRTDIATERAMVDIVLTGVLNLARVSVPVLLERPAPRHGRFVAVASAAATTGMFGLAAYSAAKAGVTGFIRGLASDLKGTGVTANAVSPGSTRTAVLEESARIYELPAMEELAAHQTIERLIEPAEVAAGIVWLAGEEADAVTGAVLPIDGGLSL